MSFYYETLHVRHSANIEVGLCIFLQLFTPKIRSLLYPCSSISVTVMGKFCINIHLQAFIEAYYINNYHLLYTQRHGPG